MIFTDGKHQYVPFLIKIYSFFYQQPLLNLLWNFGLGENVYY